MPRIDARAWVIWLAAAAVILLSTRNPLYIALILLVSQAVAATIGDGDNGFRLPLARIGATVIVFAILFNTLTVHVGTTILATLPGRLWLVGGPLTLEAAVYGLINALLLLALLSLFLAFNAAVPVPDLVRLVPASFQDLGIVLLVAITYIPVTWQQLQRVRQAQAIRGHRAQGVAGWRPLVIPLLVGGLEGAMSLAETMVARGFGHARATANSSATRLLWLLVLGVALVGWLLLFFLEWLGWLLLLLAAAAVFLLLRRAGSRRRRTVYRPAVWGWTSTLVVVASLAAAVVVLVPLPGATSSLAYTPYPTLTLPPFAPIQGLALALLALPAVLGTWPGRRPAKPAP